MLCLAGLVLAGCQSAAGLREYVPQIVTPYRIDIQQGNFITQDMVDKLEVGQTKDQVRFILGTPMLTSVFHAARWDYIFRSAKGWNDPETRRLTIFFDARERLQKWEAIDVPPAMDAVAQPGGVSVPAEDKRSFLARLLGRGEAPVPAATPAASPSPSAAPAASSAPVPTPVTPAPAAVVGASNVQIASAEPAAPAAPPVAAPATKPAAPNAPASTENKPGLLGRMFGWMLPGAAAGTAAAPAEVPAPVAAASPAPASAPAPAPATPPAVAPVPSATTVAEAPAPTAVAQAITEPAPAAPPPTPVAVPVAPPAPVAAPAVAAPAASAPSPSDVTAAIEQWRSAWATKDVAAYLASYAPDFKPTGMTRARWEAQRRERIGKPSFIVVKVVDPQITLVGDKGAVAVFTQQYESDTFKEAGRKTLVLGNFGGKWLIRDETFKAQ